MTTVNKHFAEHIISRRRCCDPSNDIETPLLNEATGSTAATSRENVQGSTEDEEPSTPFPKWLMLASILVAVSTATAIRFLQTSENQENWSFFIHLIIIIGISATFLVVYPYDVKARAPFVTFLTVGIILGLGMETLAFTTVPDSTWGKYNTLLVLWFKNIFLSIGFFSFAAVLEFKNDDKTAHLRWSRYYYSYVGFSLGWIIGVIIGVFTGLVFARSVQ
jgi:hypothetical protein